MNITQFVIILNNAIRADKSKIVIPSSKKIILLLEVLYKENFIIGYKKLNKFKTVIYLKTNCNQVSIKSLRKIGKPNYPIYISYKDLWPFVKSLNTLILNTSRGVVTHREALKLCCGGFVICGLT